MGKGVTRMKLLILRLEGMLQSWGDRPHWVSPRHGGNAHQIRHRRPAGLCHGDWTRGFAATRVGRALSLRCARPARFAAARLSDGAKLRGKFPNASGGVRIATPWSPPRTIWKTPVTRSLSPRRRKRSKPVPPRCAIRYGCPAWGRRSCPPTRPLLPLTSEAYSSLEDAARIFAGKIHQVRGASANLLYEIDDGSGLLRRYDRPSMLPATSTPSAVSAKYMKRRVSVFLTCAPINRQNPSAWQALADCCDMHRNVMRLFAEAPNASSEVQILYRVLEERAQPYLYLMSSVQPALNEASWLFRPECAPARPHALLAAALRRRRLCFDLARTRAKKCMKDIATACARSCIRRRNGWTGWNGRAKKTASRSALVTRMKPVISPASAKQGWCNSAPCALPALCALRMRTNSATATPAALAQKRPMAWACCCCERVSHIPRDLNQLPKLRDSLSFLYIERAVIEQAIFPSWCCATTSGFRAHRRHDRSAAWPRRAHHARRHQSIVTTAVR